MSALPPKADMCSALTHVGFGPLADSETERLPRSGLSENAISILIRRLLALSAFCASRADRLGGKVQRSSTQALSIAFAARCGFEDAFGQRGFLHRGPQFRRKAGPSVIKSLPQKGDGFRIKIHSFSADH